MNHERTIKIAIGAVIFLFLPLIAIRFLNNKKDSKISHNNEEHSNGRKFSPKVFEYDNKFIFL
ncbi:MAG: hypothetical protein KFF73_04565 [Cyclobacteriaceae bacterium]|nr:hypothetical protein [Cyclobacteriaceae bacterium]